MIYVSHNFNEFFCFQFDFNGNANDWFHEVNYVS